MINTGFYGMYVGAVCCTMTHGIHHTPITSVTASQGERLEAERETREEFLRNLHAELERQSREKGINLKLPPPPPRHDE